MFRYARAAPLYCVPVRTRRADASRHPGAALAHAQYAPCSTVAAYLQPLSVRTPCADVVVLRVGVPVTALGTSVFRPAVRALSEVVDTVVDRQIPSGHSARMRVINASRFVVASAMSIASRASSRIRSASPASRSGPIGARLGCSIAVMSPRESTRW